LENSSHAVTPRSGGGCPRTSSPLCRSFPRSWRTCAPSRSCAHLQKEDPRVLAVYTRERRPPHLGTSSEEEERDQAEAQYASRYAPTPQLAAPSASPSSPQTGAKRSRTGAGGATETGENEFEAKSGGTDPAPPVTPPETHEACLYKIRTGRLAAEFRVLDRQQRATSLDEALAAPHTQAVYSRELGPPTLTPRWSSRAVRTLATLPEGVRWATNKEFRVHTKAVQTSLHQQRVVAHTSRCKCEQVAA
jgi:hypothetical protein